MLLAAFLMTLIVGARYVIVSGAAAWLTRRLGRARRVPAGQVRAEIGWSLASAAIYGVPAGLTLWAWLRMGRTALYADVGDQPLVWLPLSVLVCLFVQDSWFYWSHRAMHAPRPFRAMHAVHHRSRPPTAWAAMSFHPLEAISGAWVVPALAWVMPMHPAALLTVLLIASVMGTANHMGWEMMPRRVVNGPLGRWLISAAHHERHHQNYRCNYGLYFRMWDRLCGTDRGLDAALLAPVRRGRAQA